MKNPVSPFISAFLRSKTSLLTILSGMLNSLSLLFLGQAVSHHTGNLSKLAQGLAQKDLPLVGMMLALILCYFLGAMLSGLILTSRQGLLSRRYGVLMVGAAFVLIFASQMLGQSLFMAPLLAMLSGIQNGMYLTYKDMLLRSTHMTGYLSDLGFLLSRIIKDKGEKSERFWLVFFHLLAFVLGGVLGVLMMPQGFATSMLIVGLLYLMVGAAFVYTGLMPYPKEQ